MFRDDLAMIKAVAVQWWPKDDQKSLFNDDLIRIKWWIFNDDQYEVRGSLFNDDHLNEIKRWLFNEDQMDDQKSLFRDDQKGWLYDDDQRVCRFSLPTYWLQAVGVVGLTG